MTSQNIQQIRQTIARNKQSDRIFSIVGLVSMLVAIGTLLALLVDLFFDGLPRLNWQFFTSFAGSDPLEAGILAAWVGSISVIVVTAIAAIPLGIAAGIYLEEYAVKNWFTDLVEINVANLAGVPSIIYGLLGLGLFVYGLQFGRSVLSAGLTLALLILPIIIVATREAIRAIPGSIREASYACGASKWQTVWDHILPYCFSTILTGIIIALARAFGETAPLIVVGAVGFIAFLPTRLFDPYTVLPIQMFNWTDRPQVEFQTAAAAAGFVLVVMTLAMNGIAIYLRYRLRKNIKW
ncbi:phosphate ABC transporter permease PstA [Calothrix sp. NIES-3974]|uniref:phosphate ABC transporter permease PstA n=1 Tax=Calothrix sp. NIES-3974 TaxID=2005462 RepID=UPI000B618ABC|nr:phosphate ABC transporter permease PstA [Calothrix sp. NIES-3974]BAZ04879.1 phosphate ABC transporter inner membrane subunit PstA [Calothrix sp. NIES-3974]